MLLSIISGSNGSGKSEHLYGLIKENLKNNPDAKAVLIVPEQFSYTAEKILSEKFGGLGLNRIEVLTFTRLIHRYISSENNLSPSGKIMLVGKAVSKIDESNVFFAGAKKQGIISSLSELFSEFKRYNITPEDLDEITPENSLSEKKLRSVCEIYRSYLSYFDNDFTDSDDAPSLFAEYILSSDAFDNTFFFIDEYNNFMPQHYDILRSLIIKSRGVFTTLTLGNSDPDGVFAPVLKTKNRLMAMALSENAQLYTNELPEQAETKVPDIKHLLKNWDTGATYTKKCENISIFTARDLYSEVEHTAAKITALVRDEGLMYRDIGVIVGDMGQYLHILNAVFKESDIPFFCDEQMAVSMHPIARTMLSLFKIIDSNWSYSAVFDYLRTGYVFVKTEDGISPINPEDIDILENYVLANGIRGKKAWFEPWCELGETIFDDVIENFSKPDYDLDMLNNLRSQIIAPFENFLENKGRSVRKIAEAVYNFLCDINLCEGLTLECIKFDEAGLRDDSEQYKQVWNTLLEVLDQAVISSGDDIISRENFARYIESGLSECSISIIPSGLDRVSVGTVERDAPKRVKRLFILGALHGAIPPETTASPIFSSFDRDQINQGLSKKEKELAPYDLSRIALSNLKLYRMVATAKEKLYISYPIANSEGNALSPARFVTTLQKMFPDIEVTDNIISKTSDEELLSSSKRGFYYMLAKLSQYYKKDPENLWQSVFEWYANNPDYKDKLDILKTAAEYRKITPRLSKLKAELLFGKGKRYSITALEKYNKCPFSYYLEKGLKAQPQEVKRVEKSHLGSLAHAAICEFCKKVENGAETIEAIHKNWLALTEDKANAIISSVMEDMKTKIMAHVTSGKNQIEYMLMRCENTLKKSVDTIRKSLSLGGYTAVCYEKDFEVNIDWKNETVTLFGTIDRIDIMEKIAENRAQIRIVDYKTGHKKFSLSAIVNKLDMQLVLYAVAAQSLYADGKINGANPKLSPQISAIMYNKVNDDMVKVDGTDVSIAKNMIKNKNKLDGVLILDNPDELSDTTITDMDESLLSNSESQFLNISFKKDGTLSSSSQVTSREVFDGLCDYMKKSVIDAHTSIKDGDIRISPYKNGQYSPCSYCDFKEVCMFDGIGSGYRKLISKDSAALEFMKKELEENE